MHNVNRMTNSRLYIFAAGGEGGGGGGHCVVVAHKDTHKVTPRVPCPGEEESANRAFIHLFGRSWSDLYCCQTTLGIDSVS